MFTDCIILTASALFIVCVIAILKENHDLRKAVHQLEFEKKGLITQIQMQLATLDRGEDLNQQLKERISDLKFQLSEKE